MDRNTATSVTVLRLSPPVFLALTGSALDGFQLPYLGSHLNGVTAVTLRPTRPISLIRLYTDWLLVSVNVEPQWLLHLIYVSRELLTTESASPMRFDPTCLHYTSLILDLYENWPGYAVSYCEKVA